MTTRSSTKWAETEFGGARLGDVRRDRRAVTMLARLADRPSGKVAVVFDSMSEREAAYDFLEEGDHSHALGESLFHATAARARGLSTVFVAIDITSLTLKDDGEEKIFGPVGTPNNDVRGIMVANAYAMDERTVPLGLIDQRYWIRGLYQRGTVQERTMKNARRPFEEKQGSYFTRAVARTIARLHEGGSRPWFVIDREGDNREILLTLQSYGSAFTIRGTKNRSWSDRSFAPESLVSALATSTAFSISSMVSTLFPSIAE
ncbi:MAG TPA: transposase DNA-binding-containing protein [Polyangiaceae bacterium]